VNDEKYVGLDAHLGHPVVAVRDSSGKFVMESILETKAAAILQSFARLPRELRRLSKNLGCLAVRSAQTARRYIRVLQSAEQRASERWKQK
jgi:hypothetical protein